MLLSENDFFPDSPGILLQLCFSLCFGAAIVSGSDKNLTGEDISIPIALKVLDSNGKIANNSEVYIWESLANSWDLSNPFVTSGKTAVTGEFRSTFTTSSQAKGSYLYALVKSEDQAWAGILFVGSPADTSVISREIKLLPTLSIQFQVQGPDGRLLQILEFESTISIRVAD